MSYRSVADMLGGRDRRKVGNNTYLERRAPDVVVVRLHATDILTYRSGPPPDGVVTLSTGGWRTVTTRERLNRFLREDGYAVYSERGVWKLYALPGHLIMRPDADCFRVGYYVTEPTALAELADGLTIYPDGSITGALSAQLAAQRDAHDKRLKKALAAYLKGLPDALETFDPHDATDHLWSHLEERYYMRSLCLNALAAAGYHDPRLLWELALRRESGRVDLLKRALHRYFTARLAWREPSEVTS